MEAASTAGVTMPLELVEDKSGRFFTFVSGKGPRYLLQIIHTQPETASIMRCAISLLIVTMAILRRKLPENRPKTGGTNWMSLLSGNINSWASEVLSTISDGPAISICINLLSKSKILVIQELILSLLALLVNTSEEAVIQMLSSPNHQQMSGKELEERFRKENPGLPLSYKLTIDDRCKYNPAAQHMSCLSVMFSTVADNRNHFSIVAACAEVVIAMTNHKSRSIALLIASTSIAPPPPKEKKESGRKLLLKTVLNPAKKIATTTSHSPSPAQNHAGGGNPATPTVSVSVPGDWKKRPISGGSSSDFRRTIQEANDPNTSTQAQNSFELPQFATWDALHILIQFLLRFFRYTDIGAAEQSWNTMSSSDRKRLIQAHNRIVVAICSLVALAPEIGYYIYQMPKARSIVMSSSKYFLSSNMTNASGLPVRERGPSVNIVSAAIEILSEEYQATLVRSRSRIGSAVSMLRCSSSRNLEHTLVSCKEENEQPEKALLAASSGRRFPRDVVKSNFDARSKYEAAELDTLPTVKVSHHTTAKPVTNTTGM